MSFTNFTKKLEGLDILRWNREERGEGRGGGVRVGKKFHTCFQARATTAIANTRSTAMTAGPSAGTSCTWAALGGEGNTRRHRVGMSSQLQDHAESYKSITPTSAPTPLAHNTRINHSIWIQTSYLGENTRRYSTS